MGYKGEKTRIEAAPMRGFAALRSWENREELAMDIFMPQAMLRTQLQGRGNKELWAGWRRLWWAVMEEAVYSINKGTDSADKPMNRQAAEAWAWVDSDEMSVTSFRWICQVFDLKPAAMRAGIRQMPPGVLVKGSFDHRRG